ncbi:MAG: DUF4255 domain-containing protein [Bryobacteraceae bacterium]
MANTSAIAATCEAVIRLLRASHNPQDFNGVPLDFEVYVAENFTRPMEAGVSLFLYRIYHNTALRTPPGRLLPNGDRQATKLPLDLHFLLTAWAKTASLQHEIAGWALRTMEDNPTLSAGLLNAYRPGVFRNEEAVDVVLTTLSVDDMFHIWEVMINRVYQLSIPYMARMVQIESGRTTDTEGAPVQLRVGDYQLIQR